jgi:drug/metabolite transporter (DMT)-like permease
MNEQMPFGQRRRLVRRGILLMCAAVLLFTLSSTMAKLLGAGFPVSEIVFFRSLLAFVPILFAIRGAGGWSVLRTDRPGAHLLRSAIGGAALFLGFYTLLLMPLADYFAFTYAAPLFATMLSVPLLGEKVGIRRWSAVAVGFAGVLVMLRPDGQDFDAATLLALLTALVFALAIIAVRNLRTESAATTVFYYTLAGALLSGALLPFEWRTPTGRELLLLLGIGITSGIGQLWMTASYRLAPPAIVAPFDYSSMIWALGLGFALFGTFPDPPMLLGAAIVVASGIYIIYRETVRGIRRPAIKPTPLK